jgi:hypothetical protein
MKNKELTKTLYYLGKGLYKSIPIIGPIIEEVVFERNKDFFLDELETSLAALSEEDTGNLKNEIEKLNSEIEKTIHRSFHNTRLELNRVQQTIIETLSEDIIGMKSILEQIHTSLPTKFDEQSGIAVLSQKGTTKKEIVLNYYINELSYHKWIILFLAEVEKRESHIIGKSEEQNARNSIMRVMYGLMNFFKFYSGEGPPNELIVVFLMPDKDNKYLVPIFYATENAEPPSFFLNKESQNKMFNINSNSVAVTAWRNGQILIAQSEADIARFDNFQREKVKSIISYPVFGERQEDFLGMITISSNVDLFFKEDERERYPFYIEPFATKIVTALRRLNYVGSHLYP